MRSNRLTSLLLIGILLLTACGAPGAEDAVKVGSKNFTEELILGEMYAQLLEANDIPVQRRLNLGSTEIAHEALRQGDIDLYPEYTGTGLLAILKKEPMSDRQQVYQTVRDEYQRQFDLVWLEPAPMNNTQALATTHQVSEQRGLSTLTELSQMAPELTLAAVPDFPERPDGLAGLKEAYGGFEFKRVDIYDPGLKYKALLEGKADVAVAFGTDGQIAGYDLVVLHDDKQFWPPYQVAPVVRNDTLDSNPRIREVLDSLAPKLTDDVMQRLNWEVDGPAKRDPADVAREFLTEKGLLE